MIVRINIHIVHIMFLIIKLKYKNDGKQKLIYTRLEVNGY